ncbi:MAG: hypothetical protein IJ206_08200 [Oscillospiraceae bacterium]|nr:hypothetical protein [Oscillospiraceae bacterium]
MKQLIDFFRSVTPRRWTIYLTGIVILACGITMSSKTNLGTSPVISVAYNISDLSGIPFGVMTFIYYVFLIAVQVLLLRREFDPVQCFQLLASLLTSTFIGLFDRFLPSSEVFPVQVLLLILAIVLTAIGIILTVGAQFVPNPADGLASAISRRTGKSLGLSKNLLDFVSILISVALGLLFRGRLFGIGIGTVITMLLTGRAVAILQKPVQRLAGIPQDP